MPNIFFYPQKFILPKGLSVKASAGQSILDVALENNIPMEHACEKSCACCTCHCIVRKGFNSLSTCLEAEEDLLDKAWGLEQNSRLGCQAYIGKDDLEIEIPLYSVHYINNMNKK